MKKRGRVLLGTLLLSGSAVALKPEPEPGPQVAAKAATEHPEPAPQVAAKSATERPEPRATVLSATPTQTLKTKALPSLDMSRLESMPGLIIPVKGVAVTQLRDTFAAKRGTRRHEAIDIMAPEGTPVLAATAGRVLHLLDNDTGGLMVFATDASGKYIFLYAHLDDYADDLEAGSPLKRGQLIGYVGTTGNAPSDAPHLHFAIKRADKGLRWSRGTAIDPRPLLMLPTDSSVAGQTSH